MPSDPCPFCRHVGCEGACIVCVTCHPVELCRVCGDRAHPDHFIEAFNGRSNHVGRFCFGCPDCDRRALAGRGTVRA